MHRFLQRAARQPPAMSGFTTAVLLVLMPLAGCGERLAQPPTVLAPPHSLTTEYAQNPIGIDSRSPRLAWLMDAGERGTRQTAYQLRVAESEQALREGGTVLVDSGKLISSDSNQIVFDAHKLDGRRRYYWQVRIWDARDRVSGWSDVAFWEMGLLSPQDWRAQWISPGFEEDPARPGPAALMRTEFELDANIIRARVYATSHGLYELRLNGRDVGEDIFTPGWTSYEKRLQYQVYDVTRIVRPGTNAIGATVGDGWYRGRIGFSRGHNAFHKRLALLVQLEVTYADGSVETIGTGENWKSSAGPILRSEIYDGELYDARLEKAGWEEPGYTDDTWSGVAVVALPKEQLIASAGPPVRRIQTLRPIRILKAPGGEPIADFGQNLVGRVRLNVQGPAGTRVSLRHGEALDAAGNLYIGNLRKAAQRVDYVLKGGDPESYEPHFTFQGFRYVSVEGYPGELRDDALAAVVIHSKLQATGTFETSNPLVNQLQHNIVWGQKGNFLDVPTDCPQRDERLGWTGDAQVFAPTAAFNMDVAGFFSRWLQDLAADQLPSGSVPFVIPDTHEILEGMPESGASGWADSATIIPWQMYVSYGDRRLLERQYPSMRRWVEYQRARAGDDLIWDGDFTFGDWLDYFGSAKGTSFGSTSTDLISTAYFAHSTDLLGRAARVLGKSADEQTYSSLFPRIAEAFQRRFVTLGGQVGQGTQTAQVLALHFNLLSKEMRAAAAAKLAEDVRRRGHLTTGFLGTPHLLPVLTRFGYLKEAYLLIEREKYPSWLYPVKQGATTIWERWDGIRPDGSFQDPSMNSFNHYAYGAVGDWMYRTIAGLNPDAEEPGYRHSLIQPLPGGGLTSAAGTLLTPFGKLASSWKITDGIFELAITVPPNTHATVTLPRAASVEVHESATALSDATGVTVIGPDDDTLRVETASGQYRFTYPWLDARSSRVNPH